MNNLKAALTLSFLSTLAALPQDSFAGSFYHGDTISLRGESFQSYENGPRFFSAESNGDLRFERYFQSDETTFEIFREGEGDEPLRYGDRIGLRNVNGKYITAMHSGEAHNAVARAPHPDEWEYFTIVDMNGKTPNITINEFTPFALKGAHGRMITGHQNGSAVASAPHIEEWETIYMERDTPSCDGITGPREMTLECANEMWTAAGCSTQHDHNGWINWARGANLSLQQMRNDFHSWATLTSETHVQGCQSDFQQAFFESDTEELNELLNSCESDLQQAESELSKTQVPQATATDASICGTGTALINGKCELSPTSCPELTVYNSFSNRCESTVDGICSIETAYKFNSGEVYWYHFYGDTPAVGPDGGTASGTRGGHCLDANGNHCSATVRAACDTVRHYKQDGFTGNEKAEDVCFEVQDWPATQRGQYRPGYDYTPFFRACSTLKKAGMKVMQKHGLQ